MVEGNSFPFHFEMDDLSGNSHIKNPFAPNSGKYFDILLIY
jgi:hypothetical protein